MLKIGLDKTDKTYRHFEYDDERRYGNPQVYKVLYEETGEFSEVLCSNVISIKKSNSIKNHFLDIPIYRDGKNEEVVKPEPKAVVNNLSEKVVETKPVKEEKKKSKSTKSKSKETFVQLTGEPIENKEIKLELDTTSFLPKSYEYDVLVIDNISYVEDIKYKLNELGKDGWEVCGFQTVQRMFGGCQAVIIMKKGLN
jgi:hypothetical protein